MLRRPTAAALACLLAAGVVRGDEPKPTLEEMKAKEQAQSITEVAGLPVINAKTIDDVFQVSLVNNVVKLSTPLKATDDSIVRIPGVSGLSRVKVMMKDDVVAMFNFENRDYTIPNAVGAFTTISYVAGTVTLAQAWETVDDQTYNVQLLQHVRPLGEGEPRVSLFVQVTGDPEVKITLSADNVAELRREHPSEMAKYVDPILTALHQGELLAEVDPRLAWQVFADIFQPSGELNSKVNSIVARLNADGFQDREGASADLEKLGQPAALILMRMDRSKLSEEQRGRIDAFVSKFRTVPDEQAKKFRHDRDFMIDCLYSRDPLIQQSALTELRRLTGKEIAFDFSADPMARSRAIATLRESFGTPATRRIKG